MPRAKKHDRKRQSKLAFSPVPPSSSAATQLSPQVRDRAATIALESSLGRPIKKRKLDFGKSRVIGVLSDSDSDIPTTKRHELPTPKKSSQPTHGSAKRSPHNALPRLGHSNGMFGSSNNEQASSSDSSSETGDAQSRPIEVKARKVRPVKLHETRQEETIAGASKNSMLRGSSQTKAGRDQTRATLIDESESDNGQSARHTRSTKRLKRQRNRKKESSEVDSVLGRRTKSLTPTTTEELHPANSSGESEDMPDTAPTRRIRPPDRKRQRSDSFEVPDDHMIMDDSGDEDEIPRNTQRRKLPRSVPSSADEDSKEDEVMRSSGRLVRKKDSSRDHQEEEDLKEDLDFLRSSPPPDKGRLRSTQAKPLNERQRALEALKRRRANNTAEPSSSATPKRRGAVILSDSDSDLEIIHEDNEDETGSESKESEDDIEDGSGESNHSGQGKKALEVFYENEGDADFIDDNDEGIIGEPTDVAMIPLEFSSLSRAKPRDLFKYAVEWMVQKKINPAFSSNDEIYDLTFRKLNDEVNALANSKFSSSIWTPDFTRALRARPELTIDEISSAVRAIMSPHCEACNRKAHTASFSISLTGTPYHKVTLEPVAEDSESSSSDSDSTSDSGTSSVHGSSEKPSYDAAGEKIPPESRIFSLGSTCKANAQMAHTLHHWRYHLNSWVVDYLVRTGHCTPEKLVQRDSWSVRKRQKYANKIVDEMEKVGEIRKLYRLYKEQVDFAVEAANDYKRGWGKR